MASWTLAPAPAGMAAASWPKARRTNRRRPGVAHRPLFGRRRADSRARAPPPRGENARHHHRRRHDEQPEEHYRSVPAVGDGLRHRRERIGQELAVGRNARPRWFAGLGGIAPKPGPYTSLRGASQIDKVVQIDQSPIGRTPRSNPATFTGVFDEIRKVFANTRDAKQRGYKAGRFSFNVKGGRCEECQGQGQRRIEMNFLPDLYVACPVCEGKRFNRQTLEICYRDRSIADVLDMQVEEAAEFFENFPQIARLVRSLQEVGLGYMTLGQSSTTLSGGEAQRIKLAAELSRVDTGKTVYILDEPTTGLHFDDVRSCWPCSAGWSISATRCW